MFLTMSVCARDLPLSLVANSKKNHPTAKIHRRARFLFQPQGGFHGVEEIGLVGQSNDIGGMWAIRRNTQLTTGMFL